jgi:hypothetical protein
VKTIKYIVDKYFNSITELSGFISACLVFLSGIGRYRVLVVYAVYSVFKALLVSTGVGNSPEIILFPAIVVAIYFDLANGPIFPIFSKNSLLIALPVLIMVDLLIRLLINKMVIKGSEGKLFVACPYCKFDNKELVHVCINCNYDVNKSFTGTLHKISSDFRGDKIKPEVLAFLITNEN